MEGFKSLPKMQHFKEGGSVQREVKNFTKRDRKTVDEADTALDKKIVKKAIGMHDKQEHPGEKTDLSKLRKGGRAKKDCGTVKKYKAGGNVTNVYEAKKKSGDKDAIRAVKQITPTKATAKSAPVGQLANTTAKYKAGGNIAELGKKAGDKDATIRVKATGDKKADAKMFAGGGCANAPSAPVNQSMGTFNKKRGGKIKKMADGGIMDAIGNAGTALKNNIMGTPEQNRIAQARMDMIAKKKAAEQAALLGGLGGPAALQQGAMAGQAPAPAAMPAPAMPTPAAPAPAGMPMQKRGGKVKKC